MIEAKPNSGRKQKTKERRDSENLTYPEESEVQIMLLKVSKLLSILILFLVHPTQLTQRVHRNLQDVQSKRRRKCTNGGRYSP